MSRARWHRPYVGARVAPAIKATAGRHGVYAIRDRESGRVLYVGESHSASLAKTITRHFQSWSGPTAGARYDRDAVEVWVRPFPTGEQAVAWQNRLIAQLAPRDNVAGQMTWWERLFGGAPRSALAASLDDDVPF